MKYLLLAVCMIAMSPVTAQQAVVEGRIMDSSESAPVNRVAVTVLRAKDSILVAFARSVANGTFKIHQIRPGRYILLVTSPQYVDYTSFFNVDSLQTAHPIGNINLISKSKLLPKVIVRAGLSIRIRKDTTEYDVSSFKVRANASVEDLLKELPGIQVDSKGNISIRGKSVTKVLVDGEEFFGDDPTLVTRNVKARMVDKVQVYDKTSDQAAFTGIDDGKKQKTIDLKLKEEAKNGYFGKIIGGYGTADFYTNEAMFNHFKGKKKIAAYITHINTGKIGLIGSQPDSYASGGNVPIQNDLDKWSGLFEGKGIPSVLGGGFHFDNKWNNDQNSFVTNYKLARLGINSNESTILLTTLPENTLLSSEVKESKNSSVRQGLDLSYNVQLNSVSSIKMDVNGYLLNKTIDERFQSESRLENQESLINDGRRNVRSESNNSGFEANFLWRRKLTKVGRTFSINLNLRNNSADAGGYLFSSNSFYNRSGTIDSLFVTDQYKTSNTYSTILGGKATYTEPISKEGFLVLNYSINSHESRSKTLTFNGANNYKLLDTFFSNEYTLSQISNGGGIAYVLNKLKLHFQIGSDVSSVIFDQYDVFARNRLKRKFVNWFPVTEANYQFNPFKSIKFRYSGKTRQPALYQIQPIINNNDPLNVYVGNPALVPEFMNSLGLNFVSFKAKKSKMMTAEGNYSIITNPISTSVFVDSSGKTIVSYLNRSGSTNSNYYLNATYGQQLNFRKLNFGFTLTASGNRYSNISNSQSNILTSDAINLNVILSRFRHTMYRFTLLFGPGYKINRASLSPDIDNDFFEYQINPDIDIYFRGDLQFHSDASYLWQAKTEIFKETFSRILWNAWIGKTFLKNKSLLLKVSANDILNQNVGFSRNYYENSIGQNSYNTIARYFLISLQLDFNKSFNKE